MTDAEGRLICIVGIDGSGKTTLTQRLTDHYKAQGVPAVYVWCRFESKALARALRVYHAIFSRKKKADYGTTLGRKKKVFGNPLLGVLYERFAVWSYTRQIKRLIVRPLKQGKTVFCDRYIYDTLVDLALDRGHSDEAIAGLERRFFKWAPRPVTVLYVDVPAPIAMARKSDVPDLRYLTERQVIYDQIRSRFAFQVLDGTRPPNEVFEAARDCLNASTTRQVIRQ